MTEDEYRILHSRVIEECIHLEDILKRYYGLVIGDGDIDDFAEHLTKVDDSPMGVLISYYKDNKPDFIFPDDFLGKLEKAREIRNYYAHKVFYCHTPIKGRNAKDGDANKIKSDYFFLCGLYDEFCDIYDKKLAELKSMIGGKNV